MQDLERVSCVVISTCPGRRRPCPEIQNATVPKIMIVSKILVPVRLAIITSPDESGLLVV